MSKRFVFTVEPEPIFGSDGYVTDEQGWRVYLPHQCDTWDIAGEYRAGARQAEAVAALELFIAEAQVALAKVRRPDDHREATT